MYPRYHVVSSYTFGAHQTGGTFHLVFTPCWLVLLFFIPYGKYPFPRWAVRPHDQEPWQHLIDTM